MFIDWSPVHRSVHKLGDQTFWKAFFSDSSKQKTGNISSSRDGAEPTFCRTEGSPRDPGAPPPHENLVQTTVAVSERRVSWTCSMSMLRPISEAVMSRMSSKNSAIQSRITGNSVTRSLIICTRTHTHKETDTPDCYTQTRECSTAGLFIIIIYSYKNKEHRGCLLNDTKCRN